ncbi:MAG: hypothetical protein KIS85_09820, partial [Anaerolineales bacterium]|nr:hypothetical protein [Anaerolineales bacterium]
MRTLIFRLFASLALVALGLLWLPTAAATPAHAQQPTVAVPTVTGTAIGPYIVVNLDQERINVRTG